MSNNLDLSKEQLKTLKLFSYYCGSHGAKNSSLTVYLSGGGVDWIDNVWYSETGTRIESYDKINELVNYILDKTTVLDYFDYDDGSLEIEIDVYEKKLSITGFHREYGVSNENGIKWHENELKEFSPNFSKLFDEMGGMTGYVNFDGVGDSGDIENIIFFDRARNIDCPKFLEDFLYRALEDNYGGWEINEGSSGKFEIDSDEKSIYLEFSWNTEETISDGVVGYVEF